MRLCLLSVDNKLYKMKSLGKDSKKKKSNINISATESLNLSVLLCTLPILLYTSQGWMSKTNWIQVVLYLHGLG